MPKILAENIYYLGPDGSNTYNAVKKYIQSADVQIKNYCPQPSIKKAFECIKNDPKAICILPIENSILGMVRETIDNFINLENQTIKIQAELSIPIRHNLLSKSNNISTIKTIMSHRQALSQCANYLYKNFENIEQKEVSSTSYAAQKAAMSDETVGAIANEICAELFDLNILARDINDEKDNTTRFYVISAIEFEKAGKGKTAILLSVKNKPGALFDVLSIFKKNDINMCYIDSRPSKTCLWEYMFLVELEGYETEPKIKSALEELKQTVTYLRLLGSFRLY